MKNTTNYVIAKRNINTTYGERLWDRGEAYEYEILPNGHYLVAGRFWRSATVEPDDFKKFFKKPSKTCLVKATVTCVKDGGVYNKGDVLVYFIGKSGIPRDEPYWDEGWATKRSAVNYIERWGNSDTNEYWHEVDEIITVEPPDKMLIIHEL